MHSIFSPLPAFVFRLWTRFLWNRSAPPGRGTESRMLPHWNEASVPFRWWMRSGSDVSLRTAVRHIRPEFWRTLLKRSESPRNMSLGEWSSAPSRRAVWGGAARLFALQFSNINSGSFHHYLINIFADFIEIVLNPVIINAKDGITPIH